MRVREGASNAPAMISYLEFEKPVAQLEGRLADLREAAQGDGVDIGSELKRLETKSAEMLAELYGSLTPWQKTQVARHPMRPHFRDYIEHTFDEFAPMGTIRPFSAGSPCWMGGAWC